jgi:hypothetical protein
MAIRWSQKDQWGSGVLQAWPETGSRRGLILVLESAWYAMLLLDSAWYAMLLLESAWYGQV